MGHGTVIDMSEITPNPDFCGDIYRLIRPANSGAELLDCVVAEVNPGASTIPHHHLHGEELYFVIAGSGIIYLDEEQHAISKGSAIHIPAGIRHSVQNNGSAILQLFVVNSPPYERENSIFGTDE